MKKPSILIIFGILLAILLAKGNLLHILFTVWVTVEQIETGWGYSTGMEMAVLYPWMIELLCTPVLLATVVYFIIAWISKFTFPVLIVDLVLFAALVIQYILTNLFIFW